VGQITPGPVFTTATFIGYLLKSYEGAVLATLGIFIPSFFFVALSAPFLKQLRSSDFFGKFIDGINAVSFALLLKVTFDLSESSLLNVPTYLICLISLILILKFKQLNSVWLILSAGVLGYLFL
jgi:chromate transporter